MNAYRIYDATLNATHRFEAKDADAALLKAFDLCNLSWEAMPMTARVTAVKSSMVADKQWQILAIYEDTEQEYYLYQD